MRVTAITTVRHNVGDDFVREGLLYLLRQVVPIERLALVHKHLPITARPEWDWFYAGGLAAKFDRLPRLSALAVTRRLDRLLPLRESTDKILNTDLLFQSGAPIYWLHGPNSCDRNEWYDPLIRRRWTRRRQEIKFLNLAGGACQEYDSDGSEFAGAKPTLDYIREFYDACVLTTLRDPLAARILERAGRAAPVLPCSSIFARFSLNLRPLPPEYIALNYMPSGGHYTFGALSPAKIWEEAFVRFVQGLPAAGEYRLVCHNRAELQAAQTLFPRIKTFFSEKYSDYLEFFARARFGILNRVHAAFALASFGRPSFVVGNDSRARMSELIGLSCERVDRVTTERLHVEFQRLAQSWESYAPQMEVIQKNSERSYVELLRKALLPSPKT